MAALTNKSRNLKRDELLNAEHRIMNILEQLSIRDAKVVLTSVYDDLNKNFKLPKRFSAHLTKLDRDIEVKNFILTLELERMTQKECLKHCIQRFGKSRSPSRTGLSRAWPHLLKQRINSDDR